MFNRAAHFMGSSCVIRILEIGLFAGFFIHIIQGYVLEFQNRSKRKIGYKVKMGTKEANGTGNPWDCWVHLFFFSWLCIFLISGCHQE